MGWVGQVFYVPNHGFDSASNTWTALLPIFIWALIVLLPTVVVLEDSPARRDGFLATRPMPKSALFAAKAMFVFALIVLPWVAQELIHLIGQGVPAWVVARGTLERLMFTLPVAFGCAGFAALWPSLARWARAAGIVAACFFLTGMIVSLLEYVFHSNQSSADSDTFQSMVGLYGLALALLALAVWHSRAQRRAWSRWGGLAAAVVLPLMIAFYYPWDPFQLRPSNPSLANSALSQTGFEIPPRKLQLAKVQDYDYANRPQYSVSITPQTKPAPPGLVVDFAGKDAKLLHADGNPVRADSGAVQKTLFISTQCNGDFTPDDAAACSTAFPDDILFHKWDFYESNFKTVLLGTFTLSQDPAGLAEPLTLRAYLEARVYQWRKIADLPLTAGAAATNEFGSWKFVATTGKDLYLERRQINLYTASDSRCSSVDAGPLGRMVWMVYDPDLHTAALPEQTEFNNVERGTQIALAHYFIKLSFVQGELNTSVPAHRRLVVFEKSWVGSAPHAWQSPTFTLNEKLDSTARHNTLNHQSISDGKFDQRINALRVPAPDASRREVSLYLLEFLQLLDAYNHPLATNDPKTTLLSQYVPAHLDILLDSLPVMSGIASLSVINAIELGATSGQKSAIIAALPQCPALASIVVKRGWEKDAQPQLYQLAKSDHPLPFDVICAIVWFKDPQTYPRLLAEFEANPSVKMDDLLRPLPGMEPKLDAIVSRLWRAKRLEPYNPEFWDTWEEHFRLAMRHGETSALRRVYQILEKPQFDAPQNKNLLTRALVETVAMPGLGTEDRNDDLAVLAWMRRHHAEDFVFNPDTRKFVLKHTP
jgi:hypothetical protein